MNLTFTRGKELPERLMSRGARGGKWDAAYNQVQETPIGEWLEIGGMKTSKDADRLQSAMHISARKHKAAGNRPFVKHMVSNGLRVETRRDKGDNGTFSVWVRKVRK